MVRAGVGKSSWWKTWVFSAPATSLMLFWMVLVWMLISTQSLSVTHSLEGSQFAEDWMLYGPRVALGGANWLRVVSSALVHSGVTHLAMNGILFYLIGRELEMDLGSALYSAVCLAGAIGASAAILLMSFNTPTVGASGMVFSMMVVLLAVAQRRGQRLSAVWALIAVNLGFTFIQPGISVWGHLGGLITGLFLAAAVYPRRPLARWAGVLAVLAAGCLLCWIAVKSYGGLIVSGS